MMLRRIKIQLTAFVVITVLGIAYAGFAYVGFHPFGIGDPYEVTAYFSASGGIFPSAQVTERGNVVGTVTSLTLIPHGVAVHLAIDPQYKIPANSSAAVDDLSVVGEQYVDLTPASNGPPYLHAGGVIGLARTSVPLNDAVILANFDRFVNSVNLPALETVISQLGAAFQGTGPALQQLIDAGDALTKSAQANLPTDVQLINVGQTVLDTQQALNGDLQAYTANLAQFSAQLVTSDPDLRALLNSGVASSQQLTALLDANRNALPVLLDNLVTMAQIQDVRLPGLETILTVYPPNVANGFLTAAGGHAHFSIDTSSNPSDCTQGYNTTPRPISATGGLANLNTYCTSPPSSGIDVRGAANAPHYGDGTQGPPPGGYQQLPGASYQSPNARASSAHPVAAAGSGGSAGTAAVAPYDPATGMIELPDGRSFQLVENGGESNYLGSNSWEWLLLAPVFG